MKELKWKKLKIESDTGVNARWQSGDLTITRFVESSFGKKSYEYEVENELTNSCGKTCSTLSEAKEIAKDLQ